MIARKNTFCPVCREQFRPGVSVIEPRADIDEWVHDTCVVRQLSEDFVGAWQSLKRLSGVQVQKVGVACHVKVTEGKRYADHSRIRHDLANYGARYPNKLAAAITMVTNGKAMYETPKQEPRDVTEKIDVAALVQDIVQRMDPAVRAVAEEVARHIGAEAALDATAHLQTVQHVVQTPKETKKMEHRPHKLFDRLLNMVNAGVNVWIAGPAGSGKTMAAQMVADALSLKFHFNGAIDSEYKLSGFVDAQGRIVSTAFREAWTHGGLYLFDEVDASMPQAVLAFNAALSGDLCDFPGEPDPVRKSKDFRCVAAANTWGYGGSSEYVGRSKMDAAFLDRFAFLAWDYDEGLEIEMAGPYTEWARKVQHLRLVARQRGLKVVISPRAVVNGRKMLDAGFDQSEVLEATILARLSDDSRRALLN